MANHKCKRPKERRSGCLMCKHWKLGVEKTAKRMRERRDWRAREGVT